MSSYPSDQLNNGRQMAPLQPTQMRPFQGSQREDLVSKLEALALDHTNPAARVFEPSTTHNPFVHPLHHHQQSMYHQTQQQQYPQPIGPIGHIGHIGSIGSIGPIGQPLGHISQPTGPVHHPQQSTSTSTAPLYASAASSSQFIPTAASAAAAAADANVAAAVAASYQRRHIIKCGRCYCEMKPSVSFHGWLGHCAHGRNFAPQELDYQVCGCNLAFMTAYEMQSHLRNYGCNQRR